MIVFVEFYSNGKSIGHYWMDYEQESHRKCLGHRCSIAFDEGISVMTSPVKNHGDFPEY